MSNGKPPKARRSFKVIFRIFKFVVAMVFTFVISFAVTLMLKSDNSSELLESVSEEFFSDDTPIKSSGAAEIKTLFDEQNRKSFDPNDGTDTNKKSYNPPPVPANEKIPVAEKNSVDEKNLPAEKNSPPARREENLGIFATVDRITDIKPAVEAKIKKIPHYVTKDKIPVIMFQAVVAVEDSRFYKHRGFDLIGIARAVFVNVEAGEIQEGGSTITQQTVKNLFLTSDRTFTRKAEELFLARNLEKNFDKDKILELYLNSIYYGSNFYGIYDAAQGYFGKEPADLKISECAMLAGLPNAPSLYSPYVDFHRAKQRQLVVIDAMEKLGIISKREAESARIEEIILAH